MLRKHKPLYAMVLREAWSFTWHHPILWVLGLFAALVGHTGVLEIIFALVNMVKNGTLSANLFLGPASAVVFPTVFGSQALGLLGEGLVVLIGVAIGLLMVVASVASSGALIHAAKRFKSEQLEKLSDSWHHGIAHFWSIFWLQLGKKLFLLLTIIVVSIPLARLIKFGFTSWTAAVFIFVFVVAVVFALVISFLVNYASMYIILEEEHLGRALKDAVRLFREHWLISIEMALLLLALQMGVFFLMAVGANLAFLPMNGFIYAAVVYGMKSLVPIGGVICYVVALFFVFWLGSVYSTFAISSWTVLYSHIKSTKGVHGFIKRIWHLAFAR